jgi:hypothetical protein
MSRHNMLITGLSLSLTLSIAIGLFVLIAIERENIECQRRIQFERRSSEIRANIEHRRLLLKKNWQSNREQVLDEGLKLVGPSDNPKDHANQIGQWLKNVDGNYQLAEADLIIEEATRIAELKNQIWGK